MNEQEIIKQIEELGYKEVQVVEFAVPAGRQGDEEKEFGEDHTHDVQTIHHILSGELIILEKTQVSVYKKGDVVEFPAGTTHAAKSGENGCRMIVGFKE